jgi:hypothetical protein
MSMIRTLKRVSGWCSWALVVAIFLATSGAQAAVLIVVGGELQGATDVNVGGTLYDVQFVEGTCIDLYDGCDDVSDFAFVTVADAFVAAEALLEQVVLDGVGISHVPLILATRLEAA